MTGVITFLHKTLYIASKTHESLIACTCIQIIDEFFIEFYCFLFLIYRLLAKFTPHKKHYSLLYVKETAFHIKSPCIIICFQIQMLYGIYDGCMYMYMCSGHVIHTLDCLDIVCIFFPQVEAKDECSTRRHENESEAQRKIRAHRLPHF